MRDYHIGSPSMPARALSLMAALLVAVAIPLAGATREGELLNAGVRMLALLTLGLAAFRLSRTPLAPEWMTALKLAAAIAALPLLQLIPLPPWLWSHLPGKAAIASIYETAGMAVPWHGLGLNPEGAINAGLALLPALAMFAATLTVGPRGRVLIALAAVALALAGTALGLAQVAEGEDSALRFYDTTNPTSAVGFFANRNHQASLQLVTMPLVALALGAALPSRRGLPSPSAIMVSVALVAFLVFATIQTESRAGLVLYPLVAIACALLLVRDRLPRAPARAVLALLGVGVLMAALIGGGALMARPALVAELAADPRSTSLPIVLEEGVRQLPFGTGLGTFDEVYRARERVEGMPNAYLNHAHNEVLELLIETGLPGMVLVGLFLVWFARRAFQAWRTPGLDGVLGGAGSIVVATLLLHSLVEYPLRTGAMSALFGFGCALLLPYPGHKAVSAPSAAGEGGERKLDRERRPALPGRTGVERWRPRRR